MGNYSSRVETWALYSGGSLVIFARIFCRWRMVGLSGFKPDDYLIFLSWATYTVMTYAADVVGGLGDLHALPLEIRKNLTPDEAKPYIYGTQWFCIGVATYNFFIWTLKLNMLFLYQRVVRGLWVEKFIKPTMAILAATFAVTFIALFAACRPYNRMWIVYPDQGPYCQPQSTLNLAAPLALNLVTDLMITAIPAPVILRVKGTIWKRVGLIVLFGAIGFIMAAAILRVTMVLLYKSGPVAAIWSCREDFVAIVVGQFFLIRPMLRKSFWTRNQSTAAGLPSTESKDREAPSFASKTKWNQKSKPKDPFSVTVALATINDNTNPSSCDSLDEPGVASDSSLEQDRPTGAYIVPPKFYHDHHKPSYREDMVIHVTRHVSVEKIEADRKKHEGMYRPTQSLYPTNHVRAWKEPQY
ncbi:hypothetical protein F5Y01DRAFT_323647 [Xylaria sp. FL0043]|nr:hypothetical protein F5Y01DRAFT_323647 [Xylaria sp. FL0043]